MGRLLFQPLFSPGTFIHCLGLGLVGANKTNFSKHPNVTLSYPMETPDSKKDTYTCEGALFMPRANLTPILWHLGESQCTRISTVLCCLKKTVANTTSQLYVANRLQCRSITYDMSIGLMSHSSICSCLTHKAVRHQPRSLLIGCHPGRGSAAPQPISRAEQHTRTARRFGPSAIPPFSSARCRLRAFCSFADCNHACYILKETGGSSFVRTL